MPVGILVFGGWPHFVQQFRTSAVRCRQSVRNVKCHVVVVCLIIYFHSFWSMLRLDKWLNTVEKKGRNRRLAGTPCGNWCTCRHSGECSSTLAGRAKDIWQVCQHFGSLVVRPCAFVVWSCVLIWFIHRLANRVLDFVTYDSVYLWNACWGGPQIAIANNYNLHSGSFSIVSPIIIAVGPFVKKRSINIRICWSYGFDFLRESDVMYILGVLRTGLQLTNSSNLKCLLLLLIFHSQPGRLQKNVEVGRCWLIILHQKYGRITHWMNELP